MFTSTPPLILRPTTKEYCENFCSKREGRKEHPPKKQKLKRKLFSPFPGEFSIETCHNVKAT